MAATYLCDGCRSPIAAPMRVGHVLARDYCAACEPRAQKFIEEEETLRKVTQERFVDERAALIANYSAENFKLPDVP